MQKIIFTFFMSLAFANIDLSYGKDAPGAPGILGTWQNPQKQAYGTSRERAVWFTIAEGVVGEIAYPTVELVQTRDTYLVIETEKGLVDERTLHHNVSRVAGGLIFRTAAQGSGFTVHKEVSVDSGSDSVRIDYTLEFGNDRQRKIYLMHNPIAAGTAGGDGLEVVSLNENKALLAYQSDVRGDEPTALNVGVKQLVSWSLVSEIGNVGFEGANFFESPVFDRAINGNVSGSLRSQVSESQVKFRVLIQFTRNETLEAMANVQKNLLKKTAQKLQKEHTSSWKSYFSEIGYQPRTEKEEGSILVLKALEDKREVGAFIAAPANPQLPGTVHANEQDYESSRRRLGDSNLGYRRVWPRDLYHKAMAFLAINDSETAVNIARWYKKTQLPEGWWSQNMNVDGKPSWQGYQQDQTAYPVVLIAHLVARKKVPYVEFQSMVRKALGFILSRGPSTDQERWEENGGLSPNSLAAVIQALNGASLLEAKFGDPELSQRYHSVSESWSKSFKEWALISDGHYGKNYFARMELGGKGGWDANRHDYFEIKNKAPNQKSWFREDEILDLGFVQWIIGGVVDRNDEDFSRTLMLCDKNLRKGQGYIRYTEDAYGDNHSGGAWPLLSGERALVAIEQQKAYDEHLEYIESSFNTADMLSEQDTLSVSPLGWSHANYLILLRSIKDQKSFYQFKAIGKGQ